MNREGVARLCPVCSGAVVPKDECYGRCRCCGLWFSHLVAARGEEVARRRLDELRREKGLEPLRRQNFQKILRKLHQHRQPPGRLLDVGAGHGWFLEAAQAAGWEVQGVEPDWDMVQRAKAKGLCVHQGLFPDALPPRQTFHVVTFHDVFEHLPNPRQAWEALTELVVPEGLVVLNLPSARGPLFWAARLLKAWGFPGPWRRLWQEGFPSPHCFYWSPKTLEKLAGDYGFALVEAFPLPSYRLSGLWPRLRMDAPISPFTAAFCWVGLVLARPALSLLPSDIWVGFFRRKPDGL